MLYSSKAKLDRRNSIMAAVKKMLKDNNAFVPPEALIELAKSLDTSVYYGIKIIRGAEAAAAELALANQETAHSWAGGDGVKEDGSVVFGEIKFGESYFYEYYDNGNSTGAKQHNEDGEFDINKPFIMIINRHDWNNWENDACNCDEHSNTIVLYAPESIVDEAAYTAKKEEELKELCQLR